MHEIKQVRPAKSPVWIYCVDDWRFNDVSRGFRIPERMGMMASILLALSDPADRFAEQVGTSNGGQRPSLNSGFPRRRGWPIRSATNDSSRSDQFDSRRTVRLSRMFEGRLSSVVSEDAPNKSNIYQLGTD
jgi:hypothetical protein